MVARNMDALRRLFYISLLVLAAGVALGSVRRQDGSTNGRRSYFDGRKATEQEAGGSLMTRSLAYSYLLTAAPEVILDV
jgi:hypothetical protein